MPTLKKAKNRKPLDKARDRQEVESEFKKIIMIRMCHICLS